MGSFTYSLGASFGLSVMVWQHLFGVDLYWVILPLAVIDDCRGRRSRRQATVVVTQRAMVESPGFCGDAACGFAAAMA